MNSYVEILLFVFCGVVCGFLSCLLSEKLIRDRIDETEIKSGGTKYINPAARYVWAIILSAAFVGICFTVSPYIAQIEYAFLFCAAASIAIVDFRIQRIPNQLLLFLLALKVISVVYSIVSDGFEWSKITGPLIGFAFGFVVYLVPGFFGKLNIGAGDIKYGAVIGFYLGFFGFLQTMVIMGITMALYLIYLRLSKKGNLRTMVPNGPFMSLGVAITCLFPIIEKYSDGVSSVLL